MSALLGSASLVTLLSEYETHPLAALEAISLQRSVLVADTSGLRELADRGLARAIPLQSTPEQVAAAVVRQLEQPLVPAPLALPTWDTCAAESVGALSHGAARTAQHPSARRIAGHASSPAL